MYYGYFNTEEFSQYVHTAKTCIKFTPLIELMYFMHFMNVHINDSTKVYTITWTFLLIIIMILLWDGGETSAGGCTCTHEDF